MDNKSARDVEDQYENVKSKVSDTVSNAGKAASGIADKAVDAANSLDLKALQDEIITLKSMITKFVTQKANDTMDAASGLSSSVASQMGQAASTVAARGSDMASSATDQAKSLAGELESVARRNPLGALAGAMLVGIMVGILGRRN